MNAHKDDPQAEFDCQLGLAVKVDLDGHEPRFLRGAMNTLRRHRPILLLEFSRAQYEQAGFSPDEVLGWLENDLGYTIQDGTQGKPFASREVLLNEIHRTDRTCNLLCIPAEVSSGNPNDNPQPLSNKRASDKPTIFVHTDKSYQPDQWYRRFLEVLRRCDGVRVELVDLLEKDLDELEARVRPGDGLIGRFGHLPNDLAHIRPIYDRLHRLFEGRIFPKRLTYELYDDKVRQQELFEARGYPAPKTRWVEKTEDLETFMKNAGLKFPLVAKKPCGAGSSSVKLINSTPEMQFPGLVQEFCTGNPCDWRINVIGHRVMGFVRDNRHNDFRASGSGRIWYPARMPQEIVELAARISKENGFDSMAYDFVRQNGQWRLLEISYTYQDNTVGDCPQYWDSNTGEWTAKPGIFPEDFIVEDFLREHYSRDHPAQSAESLRVLSRNYNTPLPRILLIADVPNWIFERHAYTLAERLRDEFDFDLAYQGQSFVEEDYDLIYPLEFNLIDSKWIRQPQRYVTGVRSHTSWEHLGSGKLAALLRTRFQSAHVVSQRLYDIFSSLVPDLKLLSHGVDTDLFQPSRPLAEKKGHLRLGWAGNSKTPSKGFKDYIEPIGKLPGVELIVCGYNDKNLSREQMRGFYDGIDALICSSISEGNNNGLMEAAAMGRALITTDTGTVPEYLKHGENALIVDCNLPKMIAAVERLRDDPALRIRLGAAARPALVDKFSWNSCSESFRAWFRHSLNARREHLDELQQTSRKTPQGQTAAANKDQIAEWIRQGQKFIAKGDIPAAILRLEQAAAAVKDADLLVTLGNLYAAQGAMESARAYYSQALVIDPKHADAEQLLIELTLGTSSAAGFDLGR